VDQAKEKTEMIAKDQANGLLVKTSSQASAKPNMQTSLASTGGNEKLSGFPLALASFAAVAMMLALGVSMRRRMQTMTEIAVQDGPDMYSAYAPLV